MSTFAADTSVLSTIICIIDVVNNSKKDFSQHAFNPCGQNLE